MSRSSVTPSPESTSHEPSSLEEPSAPEKLEWAERLETLRRSAELKIDARGRWWQRDQPFEHQRIISALSLGLDWRLPDHLPTEEQPISDRGLLSCFQNWRGEATTRIGEQWCYVACDMTPFLINKIEADPEGSTLIVTLNNQERWPLRRLGLSQEVLYARLAPSRLARFSAEAQSRCAQWLTEVEDRGERRFALSWRGQRWLIKDSPSTSTE